MAVAVALMVGSDTEIMILVIMMIRIAKRRRMVAVIIWNGGIITIWR